MRRERLPLQERMLGEDALQVAATVKMIQNILIGVVAFWVAIYWVLHVERQEDGPRPSRDGNLVPVPKIHARLRRRLDRVFSCCMQRLPMAQNVVDAVIKGSTKTLRGWFFCLAFVSIGLETNFRELAKYFKGGKPLILYASAKLSTWP